MKKTTTNLFLLCAILKAPLLILGSNKVIEGRNDSILKPEVAQWMQNNNGICFTENKGQIEDMQGNAVNSLLFKIATPGLNIYLTTSGLSYVFTQSEEYENPTEVSERYKEQFHLPDSIAEKYCRADMELVGAVIRKENIVKEGENKERTDYYLGGICPEGVLNVHNYSKVIIKNIYPGIDWVLYAGVKGLEYDFIVHPGADPSLIKLKYKWTDKPELQSNGSIKMNTPMGNINEGVPISYQGDKKNKIQISYLIENNEISFHVGSYNNNESLTIDPTLIWATYYGGINDCDEVYSMQEDGTSVWVTGFAESTNYPVFNAGGGAYFQGVFTGAQDAFILQFSTAGVLKWSTYYGGNYNTVANSIQSDGTSVWVTGYTVSSNFPVLNPGGGTYFQAPAGNLTAFILQFSTTGVRKWATCYGGSDGDLGNSIYSDGTNVWVTGETVSTNFPTLNPGGGAYFQGALGGTSFNVFILQFNIAGIRKWATYYGGTGNPSMGLGDDGLSIQSDGINTWVTGTTVSTNFPILNPGGGAYFQGTLAGTYGNAFILQFSNTGILKWATYYGGNGNTGFTEGDMGNSIYGDGTNVWLTGFTSSTNFPTQNPGGGAYYQGALAGTWGNAFILKFNSAGVRKWATYYGGSGSDEGGYSIQTDKTSVWVCGNATSPDFPVLSSPCAFFQDSVTGVSTFILRFDTMGVCEWATLYGRDEENDGSYICSDGTNLFVAGDAELDGYPTLDPGGGAYYLDTLLSVGPTKEGVFVGKFNITTIPTHVTVSPSVSICAGSSTNLSATGATSYSWLPPTGLSATNIANPTASPTITTTYTVIGKNGTCSDTEMVVVTVNPGKYTACCNATIAAGSGTTLSITPISKGDIYTWTPVAGLSCIACPNPIASPTVTTTYYVTITDSLGCSRTDSVTITIDDHCPEIFVPNAFSPNGDHQNDLECVYGGCIETLDFAIFDRWGNKVFETTDPNQCWDGKYNGQLMNTGVFVYRLTAILTNGNKMTKKGNITLLR